MNKFRYSETRNRFVIANPHGSCGTGMRCYNQEPAILEVGDDQILMHGSLTPKRKATIWSMSGLCWRGVSYGHGNLVWRTTVVDMDT